MGRYCGDLAYAAGIASGADIIITSETGYDEERIINFIHGTKAEKHHRLLIVITEKVTDVAALAKRIRIETGWDSRATILGHIQRGGSPVPQDRVLATLLGASAVDQLVAGKGGVCMGMVAGKIVTTPISEALEMKKHLLSNFADIVKRVR
jgi:6-phosphofructokinase 1